MSNRNPVQVCSAYEKDHRGQSTRVLVDRLWPRGLSKEAAGLDEWCKEVAPSTELRKWFGHDPGRFEEFNDRYMSELQEPERAEALEHLRSLANDRGVTLITATKDAEHSHAALLAKLIS